MAHHCPSALKTAISLPRADNLVAILPEAFRTPLWARSAHLQTLWGPLWRRPATLQRRETRLTLADGDHLWLHHAGPEPDSGQPLILLLHGLSGSQDSHYIRGLQAALTLAGHASVVINARGAGGRHNLRARFYHAGEIADISDAVSALAESHPHSPLLMAGFSIGGSRLLNWLAEAGHPRVKAAVAVSVPFQLADCASHLDRGFSKVYRNHLINQLLGDIEAKKQHLGRVAANEAEQLEALGDLSTIRSFWQFDERIVAPLHGFAGAEDYYQRCSSRPKLRQINTPTLLVQAADDPFMPAHVIPEPAELSASTTLYLSSHGGHVGFVGGSPVKPDYWLESAIPAFFSSWLETGGNSSSNVS